MARHRKTEAGSGDGPAGPSPLADQPASGRGSLLDGEASLSRFASGARRDFDPTTLYAPIMAFMIQVRNGLPRCRVYFSIVGGPHPTFKLEVLAIATVDGQYFSSTLRTGAISAMASQAQMDREASILIEGLARTLGVGVFTGRLEQIPQGAFKMFVEPA